jgi:hypothetical protein
MLVSLVHWFTHGYECETVGVARLSEQWASDDRADDYFWTGCQSGEDSGETLPPTLHKTPINMGFYLEAKVGIEPTVRFRPIESLKTQCFQRI